LPGLDLSVASSIAASEGKRAEREEETIAPLSEALTPVRRANAQPK